MAKNKESVNELIYKLANIADDLIKIYPSGKSVVVFSLSNDDFKNTKLQVNDFSNTEQFKIDISGTEFIFLMDERLSDAVNKS
jgi:TATA-box binding protein (TBP) (component of TFIID and TFIIIB)